MTAECVAEYTRRPLMVLTSADVGITAEDVEQNLGKNFKIAKKWGALLLIDEADIYLERRSEADLVRNSLVAAFLRSLEIYDGILFLTTNRTGMFFHPYPMEMCSIRVLTLLSQAQWTTPSLRVSTSNSATHRCRTSTGKPSGRTSCKS